MGRAIPLLIRSALLALLIAAVVGPVLGLIRPFGNMLGEVAEGAAPTGRWRVSVLATPNPWTTADGLVSRAHPEYGLGGRLVPARSRLVCELQFGLPFRSCAVAAAHVDAPPTLIRGSGFIIGGRAIAMAIIIPGLLANAAIILVALLTVRLMIAFVRRRVRRAPNGESVTSKWRTSDGVAATVLASLLVAGLAGGAFAFLLPLADVDQSLPWWFGGRGQKPNGFANGHLGGSPIAWSWFHAPAARWFDASGIVTSSFTVGRPMTMHRPAYDELSVDVAAQFRFGVPFRSHAYVVSHRHNSRVSMPSSAGPSDPPAILADSAVLVGESPVPMRWLLPGLLANAAVVFAVLVAIPASLAFVRWLRRHERCIKCGYSRRGLDAASACPECGAASAPAA